MSRTTKLKKLEKEAQKEAVISQAIAQFFGGITKQEAIEVFNTLAILVQFPGTTTLEPLIGCEVTWTSTIKLSETLDKQLFTVVTVIYKGLTFSYSTNRDKIIQLPDSSFLPFESWNYHELLIRNRYK